MQDLLLDTCAPAVERGFQPQGAANARDLAEARASNRAVHISPVSAQELGVMLRKGRLTLPMPLLQWFAVIRSQPGIMVAELSIEVMIASNALPEQFHADPADRVFVATAREQGLRLVTSDRAILAYAERGHVRAIAC